MIKKILSIFLVVFLLSTTLFADSMQSPFPKPKTANTMSDKQITFANWLEVFVIKAYQKTIRRINWTSCPMHPNCSNYGLMAIEMNGPLIGSLMIFDRLHRCGHDLKGYNMILIDGHIKYEDLAAR